MQRSEHRSITRYGLQQVYPEISEKLVKKFERATSRVEGYQRLRRTPERFALKSLYAEQEDSCELIELILQERLLLLADFHQEQQKTRLIATLGAILHLLQEIAFYTNLIELDEETRSLTIEEIVKHKHINKNIRLYAISTEATKDNVGILPENWSAKQKEQRKDLALSITILYLQSIITIVKSIASTS